MAVNKQDIQKLYIAYFSRPADYYGLEFQLKAANASSLEAVAAMFAQSPEFTHAYAGKTNAMFVATLYNNLFGRDADLDGLNFWVDLLERGTVTHASIALHMLSGAINQDKDTVANKLTAAETFYAALNSLERIQAYAGDDMNAVARLWLAGVTDAASLRAAVDPLALERIFYPHHLDSPTVPLSALWQGKGEDISVDMGAQGHFASLEIPSLASGTLSISNAMASFRLVHTGPSAARINIELKDGTATGDQVRLAYVGADGYAGSGTTSVANAEQLQIATYDTDAGLANTAAIGAKIAAPQALGVTARGGLGLDLRGGLLHESLTLLDASQLVGGGAHDGLRFISGALRSPAVIKGAQAASNGIDFSAARAPVTYTGGTETDVIDFATPNGSANLVELGDGANIFNGALAGGDNIVRAGAGADHIQLGNGNNTVQAGAGADVVIVGAGLNMVTLGGGADTLKIGAVNPSRHVLTVITDIAAGDTIDLGMPYSNPSGNFKQLIYFGVYPGVDGYINTLTSRPVGELSWFHGDGDTYLVHDRSPVQGYVPGTDLVIKILGTIDLTGTLLEHDSSILTIG